jgi:DNA end-binding protein Ku
MARSAPDPEHEELGRDARGAARAIWTGTIGFGLVQIPVRLLSRERPNELAFHQIDRRDGSPIGYERVNKSTGDRVEWKDVGKGYAVARDRYVLVTDEDFRKANVQASQTIDIRDFVPAASIPPEFFDRPYFLVPERSGAKAYRLLRDTLAKKKLAGIGFFVLRTREHLCAVMPAAGEGPRRAGEAGLLSVELLRWGHDLRSGEEVTGGRSLPTGKGAEFAPKEVALAEELISRMVVGWDPSRYKDSYRDELLAAIHEKAETGAIEPRHEARPAGAAVVDLAGLLEKSLAAKKASPERPKVPRTGGGRRRRKPRAA